MESQSRHNSLKGDGKDMKTLGLKLDLKTRQELQNTYNENKREIFFSENYKDIDTELEERKYNSVIIEGDFFDYNTLVSIVKKIVDFDKKIIIIICGEKSNLKLIAGTIKAGAYDYIMKPLIGMKVFKIIEKSLKDQKLKSEKLFEDIRLEEEIIGTNERMVEIYKLIGKVSESNVAVLITGESGTGKELIAKAIHKFSDRENNAYVAVNCTAVPSTLMESEFFGHEKGAFTGAIARKIGKFEAANNGTLFLDEIGDMELDIQSKLLRVLQENEFVRVGGVETVKVNVRIIAATNKDLETMIQEGKFREDLYHRLKVVEIELPPLRERKDDIPFLINYFINLFNDEMGKANKGISRPALEKIMKYDWPGNIRELKNAIKSSMAVCRGDTILIEDMPANVIGTKISKRHGDIQDWVLADWIEGEIDILKQANEKNYYDRIVSRVESELIRQVIETTNNKKVEAADILGITRNTLRAKMNIYGLD